jgi:hypothetical protein
MPKVNGIFRQYHPDVVMQAAQRLDGTLGSALKTLTLGGGKVDSFGEFQSLLCALPIKEGGLGIPLPSSVASYAHLAAVLDNDVLCHKLFPSLPPRDPATSAKLLEDLKVNVLPEDHTELHSLCRSSGGLHLQHQFAALTNKKLRSRLIEHDYLREVCSDYEKEHRLLLESGWFSLSVASTWLQALPNPGLRQYMTNTELHSVLTMRLHVPFWASDRQCTNGKCKATSDRWGYHALGCIGKENMNHSRHEELAKAVCSCARNAGIQAAFNPKLDLVKIDKNKGSSIIRPADVLLSRDTDRHCIDITVSASTCATYSSLEVGKVVDKRALEKVQKNAETCSKYGYKFTPFVLDCCGIIHSDAWKLLRRFASGYSDQTMRPYSQCCTILRRRISFALHLGIAHQLVPLFLHRRDVGMN